MWAITRSGSISEILDDFVVGLLESREVISNSLLVGDDRIAVSPFLIDGISRASIEVGLVEILRSGLLK